MRSLSTDNYTKVQELRAIVSDTGFSEWQDLEAEGQRRIAGAIAPGENIEAIVSPHTQEELAVVMGWAYQQRWGVLPYGSGSKLNWGGLVQGANLAISTARLHQVIEHAAGDLTVTVEAGVKFGELQQILASAGQFLAFDPAYPEEATIGGIVATADTGSWRQRYRGIRDQLLGISLVRYDGKIAKAGGRVVKNVAGYDLMKLLTGAYGTLGIISQVTLRVYPLPEASGTVVLSGDAIALAKATQTLLSSALTPTAVDLLSAPCAEKLGVAKTMALMVRFQSVAESVKEQSARLLAIGEQLGLQGSERIESDEAGLWQRLKQQMWTTERESAIICKLGVLPAQAVGMMQEFPLETVVIHAGSGLGVLRLEAGTPERLLQLRHWCESNAGFLTILAAPLEIKQRLEVWGYNGNALALIQRIKQQFDPDNLFSPHRFVRGV